MYMYIYIYLLCRYVVTGAMQRLHWLLTAMFPSAPCKHQKFYIYSDGTHTHKQKHNFHSKHVQNTFSRHTRKQPQTVRLET